MFLAYTSDMKVFFDFELDYLDLGHPDDIVFSAKIEHLRSETRAFIEQRLGVLKEDIDREEKENQAYIFLYVTKRPTGIEYNGYSNALRLKMEMSLTNDDFTFLLRKIGWIP
jgi:hypothetical protein